MRPAAILAVLALAACAPKAEPQAGARGPLTLDCAAGFDALAAQVAAIPGVRPALKVPSEPYRFYNAMDGKAAYAVTEPAAPAHPAVLRQVAERRGDRLTMRNTGCAYGDPVAYRELMTYLEGLGAGR